MPDPVTVPAGFSRFESGTAYFSTPGLIPGYAVADRKPPAASVEVGVPAATWIAYGRPMEAEVTVQFQDV